MTTLFFRFTLYCFSIVLCIIALSALAADNNLLDDPGFERYEYNAALGHYIPQSNAAWREYGFGVNSVRFNANTFTAPPEMLRERPLGFSPGAEGYTGSGPNDNRGTIYLEQDIVGTPIYYLTGLEYQAWVWLGGAGNDDDVTLDRKEETGGITVQFYGNTDTATWRAATPLATHSRLLNYWGPPNGWVLVSMIGTVPGGALGARITVEGRTWNVGQPGNYNTRVAVDNAHFGRANYNILLNGDFEADAAFGQFLAWTRPDPYFSAFPGAFSPINKGDLNDPPFHGGRWTPGYSAYLNGWIIDALSFGQEQNINIPDGAELALSCYWSITTKGGIADTEIRRPFSWIDMHVQYKSGTVSNSPVLRTDALTANWPVPSNPNNNQRRDFNANTVYHPQFRLLPPNGTRRVGVHVRLWINCSPHASELVDIAIDDVSLRYLTLPATPTPTITQTPTQTPTVPPDSDGDGIIDSIEGWPPVGGQSNRYLPDSDGDGLGDGVEDANRNGQQDAGETNARNKDTDGDGIPDGVEVKIYGTNPLNPQSPNPELDQDNDGLPQTLDTNDNNPDQDNDRYKDGYESAVLVYGAESNPQQRPPLADVSGDAVISNLDALITQALFLGNAAPTAHQTRNGDPNRDGFVTNVDALVTQSFFLGTLPLLPI